MNEDNIRIILNKTQYWDSVCNHCGESIDNNTHCVFIDMAHQFFHLICFRKWSERLLESLKIDNRDKEDIKETLKEIEKSYQKEMICETLERR